MNDRRGLRIFGAVGVNNYSGMDGLWHALGEMHYVSLWGAGRPGYVRGKPLKDVIGDSHPDLVLISDPYRGNQEPWDVRGVKAPVVGIFTDTWSRREERIKWVKGQPLKALLLRIRGDVERYKKALPGVRVKWLPFGFNPRLFREYRQEKVHDVALFGALADKYPARVLARDVLCKQAKFDFVDYTTEFRNAHTGEVYARRINRARIAIATGSKFNIVLQKHLEIPACGTALLTTPCDEGFKSLFKVPEHARLFKLDCSDLISTIENMLADRTGLLKMTDAGYEHVHVLHTDAKRAELMWKLIGDLL